MNTITITKQMIADEICGRLCGIAERNQDVSFNLTDKFILIKDWNGKAPLMITWNNILHGYNSFDGYKATRIPEFISKDWNRAFKVYKKLKHLS
jgi:hypothetical protein